MAPLHIHIISNDFQSPCLKHKKHWNSFTSSYFVSLAELIAHLETIEIKKIDYFKEDRFNLRKREKLDELLKLDLKCHKCQKCMKNMPELKKHLDSHSK